MATNLITQARQAAGQLAEKLDGDTADLSVAQLSGILPEAGVFGDDTIAIQLYRDGETVRGSTLRVWCSRGDNPEPVVLDAALNEIDADVTFVSWQADNYNGSAIVKVGDEEFTIGMALESRQKDAIEGKGAPDAKLLKPVPVAAIAFTALETGTTYTVTEIGENGEFCTIEDADGNSNRYYMSSRLSDLMSQEKASVPFEFEISDWESIQVGGKDAKTPILQKPAEASDFSSVL
ncbi:MAG: hypothetical protein HC795_06545 [Coleofasciculaceae cyanobacterium RL_1_1]|nr:hypothetical protein [Coleofasciculaceae cyanobacterium RL_1_1]